MAKFWFPLALFLSWLAPTCAFLSPDTVVSFMNTKSYAVSPPSQLLQQRSPILARTQLNLFDKLFEEEGILGKGVTVGKVQIALNSPDRGPNSIFGILELLPISRMCKRSCPKIWLVASISIFLIF